MRIGIYGGTFDPIHFAHLRLAEECREQLALDEVWFLPAAQSPLKGPGEASPAEARWQLLLAAIGNHPQFRAVRWELDRPPPSYTVETLSHFAAEDPGRELFLLVGGDSLQALPRWKDPERILQLARLAVVGRPDAPFPSQAELQQRWGELASRIVPVAMPLLAISASEIRARVQQGKSIRYLVPHEVAEVIRKWSLYGPTRDESAGAAL